MKDEDFRSKYEYNPENDKIWEGVFGEVYRAIKKDTKEKRAIKLIDIRKYKREYQKMNHKLPSDEEIQIFKGSIKNELRILELMEGKNHENKNTVKLYECYNHNEEIAIVMELCDENLDSMIKRNNNNFTFTEIKDILNQLNNSFKIMHENKIAHRDLKPENILVKYKKENNKNDFIVKLAGYKEREEFTNDPFVTKVVYPPSYMAPEILMEESYDLKCDLWSLGVILYILYFREHPYPNARSDFALINQIYRYGKRYFRKSKDIDFDNLISRLLIKDHKERISWEEYFNHPFLPKKQNLMTLIINKNYKIIKELGKGGFGEVILIQAENEYYALKKINIKDLSKEEIETNKNEIKLLSSFDNDYIVKFYESYEEKDYLNIIMEYGGDSDLKKFIKKFKDKHQLIDEPIIKKIILQICNGLKEIHKANIIHRDLKPGNILINDNNDIKIVDFGKSKKVAKNKNSTYTINGKATFEYMAPEIAQGSKITNKVDIYSLGCLIYELFHLNQYLIDKMCNGVKKIDSGIYNGKWQNLIDLLLKTESKERLNIEEVIQYISDIN